MSLTPDQRARLAPGLSQAGASQPAWSFGELAAAGGLYSDMHDMLAFLHANLRRPPDRSVPAMAMAQMPRAPDDSSQGETKTGLIWIVNVGNGNTFMNGETGGYHSFMRFNRAANIGIVVLANVADANVDTLALHIIYPRAFCRSRFVGAARNRSRGSGSDSVSAQLALEFAIGHDRPIQTDARIFAARLVRDVAANLAVLKSMVSALSSIRGPPPHPVSPPARDRAFPAR